MDIEIEFLACLLAVGPPPNTWVAVTGWYKTIHPKRSWGSSNAFYYAYWSWWDRESES